MPYSQTTLNQFLGQIGTLMDDVNNVYWTCPEITYALYEALLVWGAETNYWRTRGTFNLKPYVTSPYYDMSVCLPKLRRRTWTLGDMVKEIQYHLLEAPNGIGAVPAGGYPMSGQVSLQTILDAILSTRNQFVRDAKVPLSYHTMFGSPPPPDGILQFDQATIYAHRVAWQDTYSGIWTNLWREDSWAVDNNAPHWTTTPGNPRVYSETGMSPLSLQLTPAPQNEGLLDALTVDSMLVNTLNPGSTFNVPDEWVHAIKYGALYRILSSDNQIRDDLRAQYCQHRYQQAVDLIVDATSIIRVTVNSRPLNLDPLASIDMADPYWRNKVGAPQVGGILYDILAINPGISDRDYGIAADVVQTAPLPVGTDFIQVGYEELESITHYVVHYLNLKCGGNEFKETIQDYDRFMAGVETRQAVDSAKIRYLQPLFEQASKEQAERPDRVTNNA